MRMNGSDKINFKTGSHRQMIHVRNISRNCWLKIQNLTQCSVHTFDEYST